MARVFVVLGGAIYLTAAASSPAGPKAVDGDRSVDSSLRDLTTSPLDKPAA
jgi:hypothetical protein